MMPSWAASSPPSAARRRLDSRPTSPREWALNANDASVIRDNPALSRIEASVGADIGYAEYRLNSNTITFTHTRVPEALRGRGIGTHLIEAGLAMARNRNLE